MDDKLNIHLWIGSLRYQLYIKREEEKLYREAAKQVNDKLNKYRRDYPSLGAEEIWAMTAFELSFQHISMKDRNDTQPFIEKIKELEQDINQHIREKQDE